MFIAIPRDPKTLDYVRASEIEIIRTYKTQDGEDRMTIFLRKGQAYDIEGTPAALNGAETFTLVMEAPHAFV